MLLLHPEIKTVVALVCNRTTMPFSKGDWESIAELFSPAFTHEPPK